MSVAFLGPRGTFSEEAAIAYGGTNATIMDFSSFPAVTEAVESGKADVAVLPIENSIEGAVSTTLDLLIHKTTLMICQELVVPIRHVLVTRPGVRMEDIRTVMSHPQALGQCRQFLERFLPDAKQVAALSTAGAVRTVVEGDDKTVAGIGPEASQKLYGGVILREDIQDIPTNLTRFVALREIDAEPTGDDKTSIGVTAKADKPGVLAEIIQPIADARLQLTRLESRPTKGWLGTYVFLIDFEGHRRESRVAEVLEKIGKSATSLKVFGSYPRYPMERLRHVAQAPATT